MNKSAPNTAHTSQIHEQICLKYWPSQLWQQYMDKSASNTCHTSQKHEHICSKYRSHIMNAWKYLVIMTNTLAYLPQILATHHKWMDISVPNTGPHHKYTPKYISHVTNTCPLLTKIHLTHHKSMDISTSNTGLANPHKNSCAISAQKITLRLK